MWDTPEHKRNLSRVIANAWLDPAYMEKLRKNPTKVLSDEGVILPAKKIHVVEDTDDAVHLVIPKRPPHLLEHRAKHKLHPELCTPNPDLCSFHPDLCTVELCLKAEAGENAPPQPKPRPEICSFR